MKFFTLLNFLFILSLVAITNSQEAGGEASGSPTSESGSSGSESTSESSGSSEPSSSSQSEGSSSGSSSDSNRGSNSNGSSSPGGRSSSGNSGSGRYPFPALMQTIAHGARQGFGLMGRFGKREAPEPEENIVKTVEKRHVSERVEEQELGKTRLLGGLLGGLGGRKKREANSIVEQLESPVATPAKQRLLGGLLGGRNKRDAFVPKEIQEEIANMRLLDAIDPLLDGLVPDSGDLTRRKRSASDSDSEEQGNLLRKREASSGEDDGEDVVELFKRQIPDFLPQSMGQTSNSFRQTMAAPARRFANFMSTVANMLEGGMNTSSDIVREAGFDDDEADAISSSM